MLEFMSVAAAMLEAQHGIAFILLLEVSLPCVDPGSVRIGSIHSRLDVVQVFVLLDAYFAYFFWKEVTLLTSAIDND